MQHKMRRFRQPLPMEETKEILRNGRECVIAVSGDDDYPYAVPINYVYDGEHIYLHSAKEGHKIDALRRNSKMSLCVIAQGDIVPEEFTTYFRSAIVFGRARLIEDDEEKVEALWKLSRKYCIGLDATEEIAKFLKTVAIIEITIDNLTGKESIELTRLR
ncbi:MAG: pyridoxamine 5'-phosphate oxidase family protein [Muribaculaceae bacterium]|nr:pyridoxamine 5'-phosphate oxidase family protein [Muribaculaceae bacterium]